MSSELAVTTPMQMIQTAFDAAIKQGSAMEVVNAILEQQKWMIQHSEEAAFNAALKRIQTKLQKVQKKGYNKETKSWFARSGDVDDAIQSLLDDEGMALNFEPGIAATPDEVVIIGILALGAFSRRYPLQMPADGKGAKGGGVMSRTHATGAAITYGKRYLKNMIFDLRFEEHDDDGNGADVLPESTTKTVLAMLSADTAEDLDALYRPAYKAAFLSGDAKSGKVLMEAKRKREAELGGAQ